MVGFTCLVFLHPYWVKISWLTIFIRYIARLLVVKTWLWAKYHEVLSLKEIVNLLAR